MATMTGTDLKTTANALVAEGKGILAADESTGTIKKRFDSIGVESTEETPARLPRAAVHDRGRRGVHQRRDPLRRDDPPVRRRTGRRSRSCSTDRGIIPGIKVDMGAKPLARAPGETVTEGLDGLRERLAEYYELGARFAKWRAVHLDRAGHPDASTASGTTRTRWPATPRCRRRQASCRSSSPRC